MHTHQHTHLYRGVVAAHRTRTSVIKRRGRLRKPVTLSATSSYCGACGAWLSPANRYAADLELGYEGSWGNRCACGAYNDLVPRFQPAPPLQRTG